ncbi:MAG: immunoglobulin domain-containing protein [Chitinispirillaceae bacterium]|nr:immunoglobulin domain-containing protein [Chitinispirillaceae bacterium]
MLKNKLVTAVLIAVLLSMLNNFHCALPQDPNDPSNTSVTATLRTSDWTQNTTTVSDTVGNAILVGAVINLPANIDSLGMKITDNGTTVFDTMFREFDSGSRDTIWKKIYFMTPGAKTVTITPYSSLDLSPVVAIITIVEEVGPKNQKPSITVPETSIFRPGATCLLPIQISDSDAEQTLVINMKGNPSGSELQFDTLFTWTVPADFVGSDTVTFIVSDNGKPPLFDTATTIIIVTFAPNPPSLEVIGDRSIRPLETCTLTVRASDEDPGQLLTLSMTGNPEGSNLLNDSLFVWTAPLGSVGEYTVTFTTTDNGTPPLRSSIITTISVIDGTVNHAPKWNEDTVKSEITDTSTYSLLLTVTCDDPDDDPIAYTLLSGTPAGDTISSGKYVLKATAAAVGTHIVRIVAADPASLADTLILRLIVTSTTPAGAALTSLAISAGTLTLQSAPVPDTIWDTVSFIDSTITVTPTAGSTPSTITVNGKIVASGASSEPITLAVGSTEATIAVAATQGTSSKSYQLIVVRKPDNIALLTTPPMGLTVTALSVSSIKVSWSDLSGANTYTLQRSSMAGGSFIIVKTVSSNSLVDTGLASGKQYFYRVNASNSNNSTDYSDPVEGTTWIKPSFTQQPDDQSVTEGTRAIFTMVADGVPAPTYQWQKNGTDIPGANAATCTTAVAAMADNSTFYQCVITNSVGSVTSDPAKLLIDTLFTKPSISQQPHDSTVVTGGSASFSLTAAGTNLQYQWRKDNVALATQPGSGVLSFSAVTTVNAGTYTVKVWNKVDSAVSSAVRLRVLPKTPGVPILTVQSSTSLKISWSAVDGALWYRVLRSLNSGTFASVCSTAQSSTDETALVEGGSYSYRIIAGNSDGVSDTGSVAAATMQKGPEITTQPTPAQLNKLHGESVALSVAATGNPTCTYQWQKNDVDLTGKTTEELNITSVAVADSGSYRCVVTNSVRSVNSNPVKLTVLYTLNVARTPIGGTVTVVKDTAAYIPGAGVTLTATANTGYQFVSWGGDDTSSTNPLAITVQKNQMTITANFTLKTYQLTVSSGTGGTILVPTTLPVTVNHGTATDIAALPSSGYNFDNWTVVTGTATITNENSPSTKVTLTSGNATVQANWVAATYSVTYYVNGGSGSAPIDSRAYTSGELATALPNSGKLVKNSASFSGWNTAADGSGPFISCGQSIYITSNVTLYAQYSTYDVMDNDGNLYRTVTIGGKTWLTENLMTTKYNNGDPIPLVEDNGAWKSLSIGAYCWPGNNAANKEYGALYNWYAVNTGNLAPAGWHVATTSDWWALGDTLGDNSACKIRESGTTHWTGPNECANNSSGFTALGNGARGEPIIGQTDYGFNGFGEYATWWTSTEYFVPGAAAYFMVVYNTSTEDFTGNYYTTFLPGFSVRCVKD